VWVFGLFSGCSVVLALGCCVLLWYFIVNMLVVFVVMIEVTRGEVCYCTFAGGGGWLAWVCCVALGVLLCWVL